MSRNVDILVSNIRNGGTLFFAGFIFGTARTLVVIPALGRENGVPVELLVNTKSGSI